MTPGLKTPHLMPQSPLTAQHEKRVFLTVLGFMRILIEPERLFEDPTAGE
jgi:hypothetical protein